MTGMNRQNTSRVFSNSALIDCSWIPKHQFTGNDASRINLAEFTNGKISISGSREKYFGYRSGARKIRRARLNDLT